MSKITKNKWIKLSTALATAFSSSKSMAIDLQSKIKNADRSDFNTISSPFKKKTGQSSIIGEISETKQPLILKQSNGTNQTLIEGLQAFELSFLHELTDKIQLGILVPGEKPYGLIGPYNEAKNYLSNILIEPKVYISDNVALIPVYYVPSKNKNQLLISGQNTDINFGLEQGAYGLKVSLGNKTDNGITTAYQIGAIIAPESKFRDIDQTMKIQFGAGIKKELSGGLKLLAEAYGEKYKSNMPLEALAMIEYSNDKFMVRVGGGTGDIQGSGSNTTRMLANFSYYFGDEKKSSESQAKEVESPKLTDKPISEDDYLKFKEKVEKTEDSILDEKLQEMEKLEELKKKMDEIPNSSQNKQSTPQVSFLVSSHTNKEIFQCAMDEMTDEHDLNFIKELSNIEFESLFEQDIKGLDFKKVVKRSLASAQESNLLARLENVHVTQTAIMEIRKRDFHWTEEKAKYVLLNLRRTNLSLKENIEQYKKLKKNNEDTTKIVNEINWGLRVFKRNLNSWNLLISSYMQDNNQSIDRMQLNNSIVSINYTKEALELLGKNEEIIEQQIAEARKNELEVDKDYQVIVASKLNIRTSPSILWNNIAGQLANGDLVRAKKAELSNHFVEIEIIKSEVFNNQSKLSPLYVHSKYLKKLPEEVLKPTLADKEKEFDKHSLLDTFEDVVKTQGSPNTQNVLDVLNTFKVIQDAEKKLANKKATEIEVIPVEIPKEEKLNETLETVMKESSKEVISSEDVTKEKTLTNPELDNNSKKASKIEIVYDEEVKPQAKKIKKKKQKSIALPVKKEVQAENITISPELKQEQSIEVVEVPATENKEAKKIENPIVESKPQIEEVKPKIVEENSLQKEMDSLDKIIEEKTKEKSMQKEEKIVEVESKKEIKIEQPKKEEVVEVKKTDSSIDIMNKAIEQKTIELENQKKSNSEVSKDPSKVEPLKLQEDYPMDEVQKGPKF